MQIADIATNLVAVDSRRWVAAGGEAVSYPDEGNDWCFQVEDSSFWFRHRNACITAVMRRWRPPGAVFDVGGGNGYVARAIRDSGFEVVLVEPGASGIDNALARGLAPVVQATFEGAGFRDGSLPAVGLFDVLEHMADDMGMLRQVRAKLIGGGRLYLTVPAHDWLWSDDDVQSGHFRRYGLGELTGALGAAGFEVEFASHLFWPLPVPIYLYRNGVRRLLPGSREDLGTDIQRVARLGQLVGGVWNHLLAPELRWIRAGRTLGFGSSCLVVGRTGP